MDPKTARLLDEWEAEHADPSPEDEEMLEADETADRLYSPQQQRDEHWNGLIEFRLGHLVGAPGE